MKKCTDLYFKKANFSFITQRVIYFINPDEVLYKSLTAKSIIYGLRYQVKAILICVIHSFVLYEYLKMKKNEMLNFAEI